ncbi:CBS domain-containing protein [Bdellovibrio sp. NC01]|uniref:CBS domain-containing protein n=1 Tax=Bdellovibrio sp. NC01 TaxID=2220073 RepID=UPI0011575F9F|nr:CBS domain-containing protein [Bdellovibrio sp. NC01]QDK38768.1 CBS domain-containing protein [Bdellovibrio sp. NC01]
MKVKEVMRPRADVINADHTVEEAAKMMAKGDYGSLPVEREDKMVGMITDRDIVVRVVARGLDPADTKVSECMTEGINYCYDDDDVAVVGQSMISFKIRRMPVINRSKRLIGMLSLGDIANRAQNKNLSHDILSHVSH